MSDGSADSAPPPGDRDWRAAYEALKKTYAAVEEQLSIMQNLYSVSVQLLGAKKPGEVVGIVAEVLENLVCASAFTMLVWRPGEHLGRVLLRRGACSEKLGPDVSEALKLPEPSVLEGPAGEFRAAVAPLNYEGILVGAIVIEGLRAQKEGGLSDTDLELLSMLSGQAGPALVRSRERARAEAQNEAVERLLQDESEDEPQGQASLHGSLDETKLIEVFQLLGMIRKSGRLLLSSDDGDSEFLFHLGSPVGATDRDGAVPLAEAPKLLSAWIDRTGIFSFFSEGVEQPGESMSCDELVLEALRLYDEERAGKTAQLPDAQ